MPDPLQSAEGAVLRALGDAHRVFCFLDYDGTLAPLAATPDGAVPFPGAGRILDRLVRAPDTCVAIVSGRTITDLRALLNVPGAFYLGVHGLELQRPGHAVELTDDVGGVTAVLPAVRQAIVEQVRTLPGILLEDKGAALAVHYRLASAIAAATACRAAEAVTALYRGRGVPIVLARGHEVVEIRSAHVNKGKAVCALLADHAPSALALYAGDDWTDEDAFQLLPPEAVTIRVGNSSQPTAARFQVDAPADVVRFLGAVLAARSAAAAGAAAQPGDGG